MTSVVPALVARHDIETVGQKIDNLSLPFIAPLGTDNDDYHSNNTDALRRSVAIPTRREAAQRSRSHRPSRRARRDAVVDLLQRNQACAEWQHCEYSHPHNGSGHGSSLIDRKQALTVSPLPNS